jgi:hypothetical protein
VQVIKIITTLIGGILVRVLFNALCDYFFFPGDVDIPQYPREDLLPEEPFVGVEEKNHSKDGNPWFGNWRNYFCHVRVLFKYLL